MSFLITHLFLLFLADLENAFVRSMVNGLLVREGQNCTIPCLVTDPAVNHLSLLTCTGTALPAGLTYITNPERGITIRNVSKAFDGCYVCAGQMDEKPVKSNQYTLDVRLGVCVRIVVLKGIVHYLISQVILYLYSFSFFPVEH